MKAFVVALAALFMVGCAKQSSNSLAQQDNRYGSSVKHAYEREQKEISATCANLKARPGFSVLANKIILNDDEYKNPPFKMLTLQTKPKSSAELSAIERFAKLSSICSNLWADFYKKYSPNTPAFARLTSSAGALRQDLLLQLYEKKISYGVYNQNMVKVAQRYRESMGQTIEAARAQRQVDSLRALQLGWALSGANPANQSYRAPTNTTCRQYGNEVRCESY